jgi:hypothetical protein
LVYSEFFFRLVYSELVFFRALLFFIVWFIQSFVICKAWFIQRFVYSELCLFRALLFFIVWFIQSFVICKAWFIQRFVYSELCYSQSLVNSEFGLLSFVYLEFGFKQVPLCIIVFITIITKPMFSTSN